MGRGKRKGGGEAGAETGTMCYRFHNSDLSDEQRLASLHRKFQRRRIMDNRMKLGKFITANWRYPYPYPQVESLRKGLPREKHKLKPWEVKSKKKKRHQD